MYKQFEIIGDCKLYLGDSLEVLNQIEKVDLIITDPPYELSENGAGKSHFGMSLNKFDSSEYKRIVNGFDHETYFNKFLEICFPFNMFCFCSNKQISKLMSFNEEKGLITTLLIWHKTNAAPFANGVWRGDIEYIVHARGKGATFLGNAEEKKKVTEHPLVMDLNHPTVKPISIISKYLRIGSKIDDVVLDPFMGSGTTLVACAKMGRKGIGIELDQKYFDLACKRVEEAYKQGDLFMPTVQAAKQEKLI